MTIPSKILIATDLQEGTNKAVEVGIQLARTLGAKVRLAHVLAVHGVQNLSALPPAVLADAEESAERRLRVRVSISGMTEGSIDSVVLRGAPTDTIVEGAAAFGADLVVIGSHHPRGLNHLLGSVAERVVRRSTCPVWVVRLDA